jgi:hypothetical protein
VPKYVYECSSCEVIIEVRHSIKERMQDCDECNGKETLCRIPSLPTVVNKSKPAAEKAGVVVKRFIEEAKLEIKSEKQDLSSREYKG